MTAREAAFEILERCRKDSAWASSAADSVIRSRLLDRRDAALASAITLGVLQNREYFNYLISAFCTSSPGKMEGKVLTVLQIGVCQLVLLDRIPARAAVNETVALCKTAGLDRAKGLVNAVLRRIAERRESLPEVPGKGTADYLAVRYSHPLWLAERLIKEKGYPFTEALFAADNCPQPLDIQINTLRISTETYCRMLEEEGIAYQIPAFPADCVSLSGGTVEMLPGFMDGFFYVQDRAARTAVDIAGLRPGMKVLDACACPGGKSFAAAMNMEGKGDILSCDIHEKKLALVARNAERLQLSILRTECCDARRFDPAYTEAFDAVIADVPCSGFGVIGKKPEIRSKTPEEIAELPAIQEKILDNLSRYVRPGGILIYSTCTILREENESVVEFFLDENRAFSTCDFSIADRDSVNGCYTFYPNVDGTDGFFVAKLKKEQ
ncbi:MAG: 16S rRNA (cytosine(967)-C(5))-methyltransferase RsmB [Oscillospiraceae bacterium]|nr:16S rRNA (cytosine(967)-C(5))-methyltransferase RsmB [Oscillospiraceae bacterium]